MNVAPAKASIVASSSRTRLRRLRTRLYRSQKALSILANRVDQKSAVDQGLRQRPIDLNVVPSVLLEGLHAKVQHNLTGVPARPSNKARNEIMIPKRHTYIRMPQRPTTAPTRLTRLRKRLVPCLLSQPHHSRRPRRCRAKDRDPSSQERRPVYQVPRPWSAPSPFSASQIPMTPQQVTSGFKNIGIQPRAF